MTTASSVTLRHQTSFVTFQFREGFCEVLMTDWVPEEDQYAPAGWESLAPRSTRLQTTADRAREMLRHFEEQGFTA